MAKINPVKLKQDADKAEKDGRLDKAIDFLKQIVQENPRDWNTVNKIGDLYAKLNNPRAANDQYAAYQAVDSPGVSSGRVEMYQPLNTSRRKPLRTRRSRCTREICRARTATTPWRCSAFSCSREVARRSACVDRRVTKGGASKSGYLAACSIGYRAARSIGYRAA